MMLMLLVTLSVLVGAGVLLVLSRDLIRVVLGLAMLGGVANLAVFLAGRPGGLTPPIIPPGAAVLPLNAADPLPQALVLTAIVIGFALLCFALVLVADLARRAPGQAVDDLRGPEPVADDPVKPPELAP